jgi:hypothetical protein
MLCTPAVDRHEQFSILGSGLKFCDDASGVHQAGENVLDRNRRALTSDPHQFARCFAGGLSGGKACKFEGVRSRLCLVRHPCHEEVAGWQCFLGGADVGGIMVERGLACDWERFSGGHYWRKFGGRRC